VVGNVERRDGWATQGEERKRWVWSIGSGECPFYSSEERPWRGDEIIDDDASTGELVPWR
jgi:hypothetical protein